MRINKLLKEIGLTYPTYIDDILNLFGKEKITSFHRDFLMKNNKLYSYNTLEYIEFHKKLKQITTDVFYDEHYANWTYYNEEFNLD